MSRNRITWACCFVICIGLFAFTQEEKNTVVEDNIAVPRLVQKELDRKISKFKVTILERCTKEAIDAAELFIDSLIAEEFKFQAGDTLSFPSKPVKPTLPNPIILNDTTGIEPIIKN